MNQSVPIQTERPVNFNMLGDRPQSNNSSFYSFYSGKSFNRPKVIFNPGQYWFFLLPIIIITHDWILNI